MRIALLKTKRIFMADRAGRVVQSQNSNNWKRKERKENIYLREKERKKKIQNWFRVEKQREVKPAGTKAMWKIRPEITR